MAKHLLSRRTGALSAIQILELEAKPINLFILHPKLAPKVFMFDLQSP